MDNMAFFPAHLTSLTIGTVIAIAILFLVRKNHLMISHAFWWLLVAASSITFGAVPKLIDRIGGFLGIHYPPTLLMVIGLGFMLIKILTMDLKGSDQERKIRALTQRLAVLESEIYPGVEATKDQNGSIISPESGLENSVEEKAESVNFDRK